MNLLRKYASFLKKIKTTILTGNLKTCCLLFQEGIIFNGKISVSSSVIIACTDGGRVTFGNNVSIGRNVKIIAQAGVIEIGDNSHIGDGTLIIAKNYISIGSDALIAEYVVIRDQDHELSYDPIYKAGFTTAPIIIQKNVWIAAKSTILKGVHIGEGSVIAAHALVNKSVEVRTIVAGVPAKKVGER